MPEVWSKTALLINFDENDGYFDHMPSPSAPSRLKNGQYAGKSTLSNADMQDEYFDHAAPEGAIHSLHLMDEFMVRVLVFLYM